MVAKKRDDYDEYKKRQAAISRERSESGRDIAPLPEVEDPTRKTAARLSLRNYCETYRAATFFRKWSPDHLKAIAKMEEAVLRGGLFALAMPRGSGKSSLAEAAAEWAILFGHRRFVVLIGATETAACEMLDSVKTEMETNELLLADFPEACYPVVKLEGIHNRTKGQTLNGVRTRISWTDSEIVFPTVEGAASSGAIIRVAGITGRVRGMKAKDAEGRTIRPDFAIPDDPQTDDSASHPMQVNKRERILRGAIKGMAGPGRTIAMVMPCTKICKNDLSDRALDREKFPQFQGETFRMVYQFPKNEELWDKYAEIRRESQRADGSGNEATEFYRVNRAAMDEGAVVGWEDRYDPDCELSAIQSAMNLRIDDPREFRAEYQNDPEDPGEAGGLKSINADDATTRLTKCPRLTVPRECTRLTAAIDVGGEIMWYCVVGWNERFGGSVIDYGTWPRQNRTVFAANDPRPSLKSENQYPGRTDAQRVYAGLTDLFVQVMGKVYQRDGDGGTLQIERCLVDAGWEAAAVHQAIRASVHSGIIYSSKGIARTTSSAGVQAWKPRPGERRGPHWRLTMSEFSAGQRTVQFDPDHWKSFIHQALGVPLGGPTGLTMFTPDRNKAESHELFGEHLEAETAESVTIKGSTFDKWSILPHRPDNHWFDVLVMSAVAASVAGVVLTASDGVPTQSAPRAKKPSFKEQYAAKHGGSFR